MRFLRAKFGYYCFDSVYIPAHLLSYTVSGKHLRKILKLFPELLSTIELLLSYMFSLIQNYLFWVFTIKTCEQENFPQLCISPVHLYAGSYYCFINNRIDSIAVSLVVQDVPEAPSNRPMISKITSR